MSFKHLVAVLAFALPVFSLGCAPEASESADEAAVESTETASSSLSRDPCAHFSCPANQHCTAPADAPYCVSNFNTASCDDQLAQSYRNGGAAPTCSCKKNSNATILCSRGSGQTEIGCKADLTKALAHATCGGCTKGDFSNGTLTVTCQ